MSRRGLSGTGTGPWRVDLWDYSGYWYIVHEDTNKRKRIGPVQLKGVNYYDRAQQECKRRNTAVWAAALAEAGEANTPAPGWDESREERLVALEESENREVDTP